LRIEVSAEALTMYVAMETQFVSGTRIVSWDIVINFHKRYCLRCKSGSNLAR
jgi:hypothetical protein